MRRWDKKLDKAVRMEREVEPPLKTFKAVNKNLIVLEKYDKVLGDDYWAVWKPNDYKLERGSLIDHKKVVEIAERMELPEKAKVQEIATILEYGADLGIEGEEGGHRRDPTMSQCMTLVPCGGLFADCSE